MHFQHQSSQLNTSDDDENEFAVECFGKIQYIFVNTEKQILFLYSEIETTLFNEYTQSYEIIEHDKLACIFQAELPYFPPVICTCSTNGKKYVTLHYMI